MTPPPPAELRVQLPSDPCYLEVARAMVSCLALRLGFGEQAALEITLAVDESLANVIRHGYGMQPGRPIWLTFEPVASASGGAPGGLRITIEDAGREFDPSELESQGAELLPCEERPGGGRGLPMIRACMDVVEHARRAGGGMRTVLIKHLTPAAEGGLRRSGCG